MPGKVTDVGGQLLLNVLFGATAKTTAFTMQLFTDSNALADADTNTTHTVAIGGGYLDKSTANGTAITNNATVALNTSNIPTATWSAQTFTFTGALSGGLSIKGYQMLSGTTLLFEELLPTPYTPAVNGDTLVITPSFVFGNGTPQ